MRALVTGGAGFIGSNLVDALIGDGSEVVVVDDLSTGRTENLAAARARGAVLIRQDVRDAAGLAGVFEEHRPEVVFHLAAQVDVRRSVADPALDADVNVRGTINVLEATRRVGVRQLVYSSSGGALYGDAATQPTREDAPIRPQSPYGQSKYAAETYCTLYGRLHGVSTTILRYANVYGPRQDPLGEGGVIAIFCSCLLRGERPTVFGDGRQTRDYVHVGDVVAANVRAATTRAPGAFNVGRGEETNLLELIAAIESVAGHGSLQPRFAPARAGEVQRSALHPALARTRLGFRAVTELREGLCETLAALAGRPDLRPTADRRERRPLASTAAVRG